MQASDQAQEEGREHSCKEELGRSPTSNGNSTLRKNLRHRRNRPKRSGSRTSATRRVGRPKWVAGPSTIRPGAATNGRSTSPPNMPGSGRSRPFHTVHRSRRFIPSLVAAHWRARQLRCDTKERAAPRGGRSLLKSAEGVGGIRRCPFPGQRIEQRAPPSGRRSRQRGGRGTQSLASQR